MKHQESGNGTDAKPSEVKVTLKLEKRRLLLLRACAAYDEQTPEEYAQAALHASLACSAEAIGHQLRQEEGQ